MRLPAKFLAVAALVAASLTAVSTATAKTVVNDGGFEKGIFVDTNQNYMQLPNGSTTIKGWTVSTSAGDIVWAKSPTGDGVSCAQRKHCIDLTGFGDNATNGTVYQTIHLKPGVTYTFTMDEGTFNDALPVATIGTQQLSLTAGSPFTVNGTSWTPYTARLVGTKTNKVSVLTIENVTAGAESVFIDNVSITAQ
jgi:hypothetical protein